MASFRPVKPRFLSVALSLELLAMAVASATATAVLIASGDGSGNTKSPGSHVPWHHVWQRGDYSSVYLGHRWVLTAAHVGAHAVAFGDTTAEPLPQSLQPILNPDGTPGDLIAFRIELDPGLPLMPIAKRRPPPHIELLLVGNGFDRGPEARWTSPDGREHAGWLPSSTRHLRWGTNRLDSEPSEIQYRGTTTRVLAMTFSAPETPGATRYESQAVVGDSGGAVFAREAGGLVLAGIMIVRSEHAGQPVGAALFGNRTYAADLSLYRDQLIALTRPDCADERDNDADGLADYPSDPDCRGPGDDSERPFGPARPLELSE
jgi:hypothetical protein